MTKIAQGQTDQFPLPPLLAEMQARLESLFLKAKALEQENLILRARQPVMITRPSRPGLITKAAMRLSPRLRRRRQAQVLRESGLFDPYWYRMQNPDVAEAGIDPRGPPRFGHRYAPGRLFAKRYLRKPGTCTRTASPYRH